MKKMTRLISAAQVCLLAGGLAASGLSFAQGLNPSGEDRSMALLQAVKSSDRDTALNLLNAGTNANIAEANGTTALHWAVQQDDFELTTQLLRADANANAKNRYAISAIYLAAQNGSVDMLELLLNAGANPNEVFNEGETVLMTAARTGDYDTVQLLLESGAKVEARENWHGQTALMWAVAQNHPQLIELFIEHGADINTLSNLEQWETQVTAEPRAKWLPPGAMSPLLFAAREGCNDCIQILLDAGADIDLVTPKGISSLLIAIINGHYDIAWTLIENDANVNLVDDTGQAALYAAVHFNTMPESNRPSPRVIDNEHSSFDLIANLLKHGAEVNAQLSALIPFRLKLDRGTDSMLLAGTTPFLRAAKGADVATMELLLEYGADANLNTTQNNSPLMTAANLGTRESDTTGRYKSQAQIIQAIQICLDQGLDINTANATGRTAIFGAAMFGLDEVVQFLFDNGGKLDIADKNDQLPLDAAMGNAGGFGFVGNDGVFQESTVALIQRLQ